MRIISGKFKGKKLISPKDLRVRPTLDRQRESIFNIIEHAPWSYSLQIKKGKWKICDLYCGTGALGIEAYSRGGAHLTLVDQDIKLCQENIKLLNIENVQIIQSDCLKVKLDFKKFDLIFMDPPYEQGLIHKTFKILKDKIHKNTVIIAEYESHLNLNENEYELIKEIKTKRSKIMFSKLKP